MGYEPGIVSKLFERLGVADVFGSSQTTASQMRYVVEGTATPDAAGVAEGAVKPESTLVMSETTEPVRKIATVLPISDELLADALRSRRTSTAVCRCSSESRRSASCSAARAVALANWSGCSAGPASTSTRNSPLTTTRWRWRRVIANTAGSAFLAPDTVIMLPTKWLTTRLFRDDVGGTAGQFYGGGPFSGAYGGAATNVGMFGQTLWNTMWCCPTASVQAPRWSATSARAPTSGVEAACRSRPRTPTATCSSRTSRC
jgi:hypothetical protein